MFSFPGCFNIRHIKYSFNIFFYMVRLLPQLFLIDILCEQMNSILIDSVWVINVARLQDLTVIRT